MKTGRMRGAVLAISAALIGSVAMTGAGQAEETSSLITPIQFGDQTAAQAYLLALDSASTGRVFRQARAAGEPAVPAAREQKAEIREVQADVAGSLPDDASVLYRTHNLLAGLGVTTDQADETELESIPGVRAVYPIAPKSMSNSYAGPLQGAPAAWEDTGVLGDGVSIAIIDSGIDYTHSNFGGSGSIADFDTAQSALGQPTSAGVFPGPKVVGGYDLVGDAYNAGAPAAQAQNRVAQPDPFPLDCGGHGSHVAGSAAGYGENADGSTYSGTYGPGTNFNAMKIGPGIAPRADLYAYRVFGCDGSTNVIAAALDRAADPDGDNNPSDHVDVVNMSLGSNFGLSRDGDSVMANAAVNLGMTLTVSAGNSGDLTDVSGSPGNAEKVITVANSKDADTRSDGGTITFNGSPEIYAVSRADNWDWLHDPDLEGPIVAAPISSETACTAYPANTFNGEVVMVKWTQDALECGSKVRGDNLAAAGAGGYIFHNDSDTFAAGILGSELIPGVLMNKTGGDAIRAGLTAGDTVEAAGTSIGTVVDFVADDNNKMTVSSSRGIHEAGNVKPDVSAVGSSVFSTYSGAGTDGTSMTGTSMAAPMVAGLAALVHEAHPGWLPLQVKADIMNTAGQDLFLNGSASSPGPKYAPVRAGAGRIKADDAVENEVLAFASYSGAVSVSFGPVEAAGPVSLTRSVTVQNTGGSEVQYDASYDAITSVPGVQFSATPATFTVAAGGARTVDVKLSISDPGELTKTVDPTIGRLSGIASNPATPRTTLAEASGRLLLTPDPSVGQELRVPVYAAPRPASDMTQDGTVQMSGPGIQTGELDLAGSDLGQNGTNGTGDADPLDDIVSIAAGFELQATSPQVPECVGNENFGCYRIPDDRAADLENIGYSSNAPGITTPASGRAFFAVSTHAPANIPADRAQIQFDIDVDGDGAADLFLFNNRVTDQDVFIATAVSAEDDGPSNSQLLNAINGSVDTAMYDSDAMILPLSLPFMANFGIDEGNPRITYGVEAYSGGDLIDIAGLDADTGEIDGSLSADLFNPGVRVTDGESAGLLQFDQDQTTLEVERNAASFRDDDGKGLLMIHLHNEVGNKAQVVDLTGKAAQALGAISDPVNPVVGGSYVPVVSGGDSGNPVVLTSSTGGICSVAGGIVDFTAVGTCKIKADQAGDDLFDPAPTVNRTFTVAPAPEPSDPGITARASSSRAKNASGWYRTPVKISFFCDIDGSPLTAACPAPVVLSRDGAGQSVSRTITSIDGGSGSVKIKRINIDRTLPTARIRGVRKGKRYRKAPTGRCIARDATSGVSSCRLKKKRLGKRVVYKAIATDRAGNARVTWVGIRLISRQR